MTQFLLIVFLALPTGEVTTHAALYAGADLCLSRRDDVLVSMRHEDPDTYSVQCIDSTLYRVKPKDT